MNKAQLLQALEAFLSQLHFHPALPSDLLSLLRQSGIEQDFLKEFVKMLTKYDELGRTAAEQLHDYEQLDTRLYSMHIANGRRFNIRILYAYHAASGQRVLLHAFWERRSEDYTAAIAVANDRLNELEEDTQ